MCAERAVGHEPFAILLADDLIFQESGSITASLAHGFYMTGKNQLSTKKVKDESISKYGVIELGTSVGGVSGLIEKPAFSEAPSDLASIGRYVVTPDIFEVLRSQKAGVGGEIQLADALDQLAKNGQVRYKEIMGNHFDCGSVNGYLDAICLSLKKKRP